MIDRMVAGMLYPAPPVPVPPRPPAPLEDRTVRTDAGGTVSAWGLEAGDGATVLWLHGNGENLATLRQAGVFDRFAAMGRSVVALDYPGYGRSSGRPSESSLVEGALAVFDSLAPPATGRSRIVVGWSLGAAVSARIAAARAGEVDGLVLLSPWERLATVASHHFPGWLVRRALADRWDSAGALGRLGDAAPPTLMMHGFRDRIIPISEGRALRRGLPAARWVEVPAAGHNDLLGEESVWDELRRFFREVDSAQREGAREAG